MTATLRRLLGAFTKAITHRPPAHLVALAKEGDAEAQYQLGVMYQKGDGVRKNPLAARKWFSMVADQSGTLSITLEGQVQMEADRRALMSLLTPEQVALYEARFSTKVAGMTPKHAARQEAWLKARRRDLGSRITPKQAAIAQRRAEKNHEFWVSQLTPEEVARSRRAAEKLRMRTERARLKAPDPLSEAGISELREFVEMIMDIASNQQTGLRDKKEREKE